MPICIDSTPKIKKKKEEKSKQEREKKKKKNEKYMVIKTSHKL